MAEKKHGLGTVLLVGAAAAAVAGGVVSYLKRAEIQRLAEDIISRVRPADGGDYPDTDRFCDAACAGAEADAAEMNIVDSGLSLEAVGNPEETEEPAPVPEPDPAPEAETEPCPAEEAEPVPVPAEQEPEPEPVPEAETAQPEPAAAADADDGQPKKKTWFWSK